MSKIQFANQVAHPRVWSAILLVALATGVMAMTTVNALAANASQITDQELITILRNAKIVDPATKLTASISGDQVSVTTTRKAKATDAECKIEAVLLGKSIFEAVTADVQRSKVTFFDYGADSYSEVVVKRAEVKMFGAGQLSEKELLSSLELKTSKADDSEEDNSLSVVAGPLQPQRAVASGRLQLLQNQGTNVTPFRNLFAKVEEAAKSGDLPETRQLLKEFNKHLKEQEELSANVKNSERSLQSGQRPGLKNSGGKSANSPDNGQPPSSRLLDLGGAPRFQVRHIQKQIHNLSYENVSVEQYRARLNSAIASFKANNGAAGQSQLDALERDLSVGVNKKSPNH